MRNSFWTALAVFVVVAAAPAAHASSIDALYAFGDSLSDVGNDYLATGGALPAPPYVNGQFSNGNVWVQDLASDLGLPSLTPSLAGGTDYAYGGAETAVTSFNTAAAQSDLLGPSGQIAQFQAAHATADPNALYTLWIGSNDLIAILASASPSQIAADLATVVGNIDTAIGALAGDGAKNFLVLTVPDLAIAPQISGQGPGVSAAASALSAAFDTSLVSTFATLAAGDSVDISVLDTYSFLNSVVAHPSTYGFTNVTGPCYTGTDAGFADTSDPGSVCTNPNQYFFWDELHPTAAGHLAIADAALATVTPAPEPSSLLLLGTGLLGVLALAAGCKGRARLSS